MTNAHSSWLPKVVTFALSAVAAASVVYWGLKEWRIPAPLDVSTALSKPTPVTTGMLARALGGGNSLNCKRYGSPTQHPLRPGRHCCEAIWRRRCLDLGRW